VAWCLDVGTLPPSAYLIVTPSTPSYNTCTKIVVLEERHFLGSLRTDVSEKRIASIFRVALVLQYTNSRSAGQEIPCYIRNPAAHHRVHNSTPIDCVLPLSLRPILSSRLRFSSLTETGPSALHVYRTALPISESSSSFVESAGETWHRARFRRIWAV
jgi:hypothetical protein